MIYRDGDVAAALRSRVAGNGRGSNRRGGGRRGGGGAPVFDPRTYGTLAWWLRGDDVTLNGADVSSWNDKSGNARHWTQGTAARQPAFTAATALNSRPGLTFTAANTEWLGGPNLVTVGLTAAESFVVMKRSADPAAASTSSGLYCAGAGVAGGVPFTDGIVYDAFGSTIRKTTADFTTSFATAVVYNARSAAGEWTASVNGATSGGDFYTTATNTVGWSTTPAIGQELIGQNRFMDGVICEWIVYAALLSVANRARVVAGLKSYYGIA